MASSLQTLIGRRMSFMMLKRVCFSLMRKLWQRLMVASKRTPTAAWWTKRFRRISLTWFVVVCVSLPYILSKMFLFIVGVWLSGVRSEFVHTTFRLCGEDFPSASSEHSVYFNSRVFAYPCEQIVQNLITISMPHTSSQYWLHGQLLISFIGLQEMGQIKSYMDAVAQQQLLNHQSHQLSSGQDSSGTVHYECTETRITRHYLGPSTSQQDPVAP